MLFAEAVGARGIRVETADETRVALEGAQLRGGVTLVEAIVDARAYTGGE